MNYQIGNEELTLTISDMGAEMQSIMKDGKEYLWNGDETYWPERAPILFPYVGRFTDGKYLLNGKEYEMDIHGFARHLPYRVVYKEENVITFELCDNEDTYKMYPCHFVLQANYEVKNHKIGITYHVENHSDDTMYFGIGGHPGFALPFDEGLDFSDYYLEFSGACRPARVRHTPACFVSGVSEEFPLENGRSLRLSHDMFDNDAIVLREMADEVTLKSDKGNRKVTVSYPNLPFLGFWHAPKTEAPYICIEPWTSLPSRQDIIEEFRYKSDLVRLAAGGVYENAWSITVD